MILKRIFSLFFSMKQEISSLFRLSSGECECDKLLVNGTRAHSLKNWIFWPMLWQKLLKYSTGFWRNGTQKAPLVTVVDTGVSGISGYYTCSITDGAVASAKKWCYCNKGDSGEMIGCDDTGCCIYGGFIHNALRKVVSLSVLTVETLQHAQEN